MTFQEAVAEISRECDELLISKQRDYGHGNINAFGELGVLVRMSDKLERLKNLMRGETPKHEAIEDTLMDIRNYATIWLMLRRDTFDTELGG